MAMWSAAIFIIYRLVCNYGEWMKYKLVIEIKDDIEKFTEIWYVLSISFELSVKFDGIFL